MTRWTTFLFLATALASTTLRGQTVQADTLTLVDDFNKSKIIVSKADYLIEVKFVFKDSIKYSIIQYINSLQTSSIIEINYFVNLDYYERYTHASLFDNVLYNLYKQNKILFIKDSTRIKPEEIKIKVIPVYRCKTIYCGKDWGLYYKNILLTRFEKSRNRNAYSIIDCF